MFSPFILQKQTQKPEKALRAEVLSRDLLAARAAELAEFYSTVQITPRGAKLQQRFKENTKILNSAYFAFSGAARRKEVLTAGAEWLLDNYHVIDEQVREIRRDLPRRYYKALPKLSDSEWKGYPRVYRLVYDFISHTDATVETESLTAYIEAYQSKTVLLIGEIWAVPIMLRLALVENLRRLAQRSLLVAEHRRAAERLCQEVIDSVKTGGADLLISLVNRIKNNPEILEFGAASIVRHLRARGGPAALALQWIDEQLREKGIDPNEVARLEQQAQATDQISVGNSVTALKTIGSLNWRRWFESVSKVDGILVEDPSGLYMKSDFTTRDMYRHKVEKLARLSKHSEIEVAEEVVRVADKAAASTESINDPAIRYRHIGYYLVDEGIEELKRALGVKPTVQRAFLSFMQRHVLGFYLGAIAAVIGAGLLLGLIYSFKEGGGFFWALILLLLAPTVLSEFAIQIVQWVVTKITQPQPLAKLDFEEGISEEAKTVVVVQNIFSDIESVAKACELLEIRAIGNQDDQLSFGVLADLCDAPTEVLSGDIGIVNRARELINDLNARYGKSKFFMLFRRRLFNPQEGKFMGWERKRGKLMEFNHLLRGATDTTFNVFIGDVSHFQQTKFVITLDGDTQLPPGVASKLVGTIAHPLNRAVFNEQTDVVVKGYSIIQPRVGITVQSGNASRFASVFSGHSGLDPYTRTVSDVYQDLFGEGSYIGKGVYDIDAFERALTGRFPENTLLSHDLIEGSFGRCGLASDIEVFDEYPVRYHAQAKRQHRWIRGDWQIIQWIAGSIPNEAGGRYPTPISWLSRWKLFDNLRRSLYAPALFLLLLMIWAFAPGSQWMWLAAVALVVSFPVWNMAWILIFDLPFGYSFSAFGSNFIRDLRKNIELTFFQLVLLPHQAYISINAAVVTLHRLFVSKVHLLEWETAYASERRLGGALRDFTNNMRPATTLLAVAAAFELLAYKKGAGPIVFLFFMFWFAAPVIAWAVSRLRPRKSVKLKPGDEDYLKQVAFATWRYFDTMLKPEYNYLIPDNLQVVPKRVVAERTSPTNISLSVLSVISAYDLGFIPLSGVIDRVSAVFATLRKLEKFHGHFLNWYEVKQLRPLYPRYISTVDSGNLVGHFIAVYETLSDFSYTPLITKQHLLHVCSLLRTLKGLPESSFGRLTSSPKIANLKQLLGVLADLKAAERELVGAEAPEELKKTFSELLSVEQFVGWTEHLPLLQRLGQKELLPKKLKDIERILEGRAPTLSLIIKITNRLAKVEAALEQTNLTADERKEFDVFLEKLKVAHERALGLEQAVARIRSDIEKIVRETDFRFLSDPEKNLLIIGYNIDNGLRDNSFYDLFASEARLASLVAIAKGDLPQTHWFMLNRALTDSPGGTALLSWGGTMFEYLMPVLVTKDFPATLLSETYHAVIKAQRAYARRRGVPWGVSESAFSGVDFENTYQYRAFGIPGLGLKRGLGEDLVVSPYSTAMSLMIDPEPSITNLHRLEMDGLRGEFGFYDAVDYTSERLGAEERCHVVKSFLAHHQGMSLVSINNLLNNDIFQERFHSNPTIRACELLLQERFPSRIPVLFPHRAEVASFGLAEDEAKAEPFEHFFTPHTRYPRTRILSNGNFTTIIDNAGSGVSLFESHIALSRFRDDALRNNFGSYIYMRDLDSRVFWSAGYAPTRVEADSYETVFSPDKVEIRRRDRDISTRMEVTVSPEDNVEVRRVLLTNLSHRSRRIELTSFGEVALASVKADLAHPAFSKMFVYSEFLEDFDALLFTRKPRDENEGHLYLAHLVHAPSASGSLQYETARQNFIGRGLNIRAPLALANMNPLPGATGTVLDPVYSLRTKVEIKEGGSQTVSFVTMVGRSREQIIDLIKKYREGQYITRAFEMAWSHSDVEMRHQQFSISRVLDFQKLANAIIYNYPRLRASDEILKKNCLPQSGLWRFGISGDDPIVLLTINDREQIKVCEDLLLAHEYLRQRGFRFDLVILNEYPGGYFQELQHEIEFLIKTGYSRDFYEKNGGIFLRAINQLSEDEVNLLYSAARVVIAGNKGTFSAQLALAFKQEPPQPPRRRVSRKQEFVYHPPYEKIEFPNDFGGFADEGKSYSMTVRYDHLPPQPWVNIIGNKNFGFLVSESGGGYTWADNSRENKLSPWRNDPVTDAPGEVIYIRDRESGNYWCPTPRPVRFDQPVRVRHSFGLSSFATQVNQVFSELTISSSPTDRVKWWYLELVNGDFRERSLDLFLYFEPVLGVSREDSYRYLQSSFDNEQQILAFSNPFNTDFPRQCVFFGSNRSIESYTASRREFIGRHRDLSEPLALEPESSPPTLGSIFGGGKNLPIHLSGTVGSGFDSCAAIKVHVDIPAGERSHVLFFVGKADSLQEAKKDAARYRSLRTWEGEAVKTRDYWSNLTKSVQVRTPDRKFDIMTNGWLLYQTLSCRIFGRTGFYQSSGAFGFRDQLQDSLALLVPNAKFTKEQILLHASRQFVEGDVQHWWHPPSGRGIRTRISDNYLWLPYAVEQYLQATGDISLLDEEVPFLEGPVLEQGINESYNVPAVSARRGKVLEHCLLALDRSIRAFGPHGLPLIGTGDWNDGLNRVGIKGQGESIWLGWFTAHLLRRFSEILGDSDKARGQLYKSKAEEIVRAIESQAWDGSWYRRAYFDNGKPLGSAENHECRIDSIAQSWGVISGLADPTRRAVAMSKVYEHLVKTEEKVICLLWPPFEKMEPDPGYIQAYPPGIRENGGQYSHAAAWVVAATAVLGDGDRAFELLDLINPITHTEDAEGLRRYKAEPYVMCGDVYSCRPHAGRGGWSWYTGSSGWLYRIAVEYLIGLKVRGEHFVVDPCIPRGWKEFEISYRREGVTYQIKVLNPNGLSRGVARIEVAGQAVPENKVKFVDFAGAEKTVNITVIMG